MVSGPRIFSATMLLLLCFAARMAAQEINYSVPGLIVPLKQPDTKDCWATAATMLISWKEKQSFEIADVVARAGATYIKAFKENTGISGAQKPAFLNALGLKAEGPQNFTVKGWEGLLRAYGPLWVTTAASETQNFGVHARIMTKIEGDGTADGTVVTLIDPADGEEKTESLTTFGKKYEQIATEDLGQDAELRPQVVHY